MAIPGNPKDFARDVANGFFVFNRATCRKFAPEDLKTLHQLLELVGREIRGQQIPLEDMQAIQQRNLRLTRVNQSLLFIRAHAKRHRLAI